MMTSPSNRADPYGLTTTKAPVIEPMLLTPEQAAAFVAVSERTLWSLGNSGEIPRVMIGRSVRYDRRDLIAWIDRKKIGGNDAE